ncbi:MAG: CBS domain-containing protein [candidate division Zixibacteria bacterium]|nr:CBS domain-containing protein [candidate division Zixibacteria bacterium]
MTEKKVKDIMIPLSEYVSVSVDDTIKDALAAIRESHANMPTDAYYHRAVLVRNEDGEVVGKLGYLGFMGALDQKYDNLEKMKQLAGSGITKADLNREMTDLGFWTGCLPIIKKRASEIKMEQVMIKFEEAIHEDSSLAEAMHLMAEMQILSLLTTRDGKITGVIRLSDLFEEITDCVISED